MYIVTTKEGVKYMTFNEYMVWLEHNKLYTKSDLDFNQTSIYNLQGECVGTSTNVKTKRITLR